MTLTVARPRGAFAPKNIGLKLPKNHFKTNLFLGAKAPLGLASVTVTVTVTCPPPKSFKMQYLAYFLSLLIDIVYTVAMRYFLEGVWRMS